jgi:hypothetical protein
MCTAVGRYRFYSAALFAVQCVILQAQQVQTPGLNFPAGYYPDSLIITFSCSTPGALIYYTTNGSEPTPSSALYTAPLVVRDRSTAVNSISLVPTNPGFNFPVPGYDSLRADTRGWLPPYDTVNKGTVLKIKAFRTGYIPSNTVTSTYFIGAQLSARYPYPVLSITADSTDLFSDSLGIFVYGNDSLEFGNYSKPLWEKKVFVELFDPAGTRVLAQYCDMRTHGNGGRHAPQKSLVLQPNPDYGVSGFNYALFPQVSFTVKELLVRNSGHRPDCIPRDDIAARIINGLDMDVQMQYPCVVFVNGEYWGMQTGKNMLDLKYLESCYNISKYQASIVTGGGQLDGGMPGDEQAYLNFLDFLSGTTITLPQNYSYVNRVMNVESFTDFECAEIWIGNGDWPNNNTRIWRYKSGYDPAATSALDGRFHWMIFDMDAGFGGDCNNILTTFNTLNNALDTAFGIHTLILRTLINNPTYRTYFINRFADLMNTTFEPNRVRAIMTQVNNLLTPGMLEHVQRWRYPSVSTTLLTRAAEIPSLIKWNSINAALYSYAGVRPGKVRKHIITYFNLADTVKITLDVSDTSAGKIKMNTIYIDRFTHGIGPVPYPWTGTYFDGNPVTIQAIVNPGYIFLNWNDPSKTQDPITLNVGTDTVITAVFGPDPNFTALHYLYINEVMTRNVTNIHDDHNQQDDWLEIYNPNNFTVDIAGCFVSNDALNKTMYRIPNGNSGTVIPPKGFMLLWADSTTDQGAVHTNFRFGQQGNDLYLTLPDGNSLADSVIIPPLGINRSWGRSRDGDPLWITWEDPTPKRSNLPRSEQTVPETLLYPNPAFNTDHIFFSEPVTGIITDALGCKVADLESAASFNILTLAKGVYFLRTSNGEIVKFVKL